MDEAKLELYWSEIPIGKENAITYFELCPVWGKTDREVRSILHKLSCFDNGDDYILIRSSKRGGGFYKTKNIDEITAYKNECLKKGKSIFAPVKKINRVLRRNDSQITFENNLRVIRCAKGMRQKTVCYKMYEFDPQFDESLLSKMENNVCLPTPYQLSKLAEIYGCDTSELITDLY